MDAPPAEFPSRYNSSASGMYHIETQFITTILGGYLTRVIGYSDSLNVFYTRR